MRNSGRGDPAQRHNFAANHSFAGADGLKNPESGLVGKGFRYFLDTGVIHWLGPV